MEFVRRDDKGGEGGLKFIDQLEIHLIVDPRFLFRLLHGNVSYLLRARSRSRCVRFLGGKKY